MAAFAVGTVVLVHFPFSDLTNAKLRPALVLANAGRSDYILCQITSNPYADPRALELHDDQFSQGGLQHISYIRPAKLFTANDRIIARAVGTLDSSTQLAVVESIDRLLREGIR